MKWYLYVQIIHRHIKVFDRSYDKKKREKLLQIFSPENFYMQLINTCNGNSNPTKKNVHERFSYVPENTVSEQCSLLVLSANIDEKIKTRGRRFPQQRL